MNPDNRQVLTPTDFEEILNRKKIGTHHVVAHDRAQMESNTRLRFNKKVEEFVQAMARHGEAHGLTTAEARYLEKVCDRLEDFIEIYKSNGRVAKG